MAIIMILIINNLWHSSFGKDNMSKEIYMSFLPMTRALPAPGYLDLKSSVVKMCVALVVSCCLVFFFDWTVFSIIVMAINITSVILKYWARKSEFNAIFRTAPNTRKLFEKTAGHCAVPLIYAVYSFIVFFVIYGSRL